MIVIGDTVSHYRITGKLGAGGMGVVYRARDLRLERDVALKFPSRDLLSSRATIDRFEQEARSAAAINHPNICTIYEVGEHENTPYISMELLEGETLRERLQSGVQPLNRVLDWGIQIADALEAAHRRGIMHRDLKPANLFLTSSGSIKILDFGLAKLRPVADAAAAGVTQTMGSPFMTDPQHAPGTPAYMSPEQARAEDLDARTDLFSFGIVLYEMASGRVPFDGKNTASILGSILADTPPVASKFRPALPEELDRIIAKALEKDRDVRYQSAADIRADLKRLRRDTESRENVSLPRVRPKSKHSFRYGTMAAVIIVTAAVAAMLWFQIHNRPAPYFEHAELTQLTSTGEVSFAAISPDGKYVAYSTGHGKSSLRLRQVATGTDIQIAAPADIFYGGITFSPDNSYIYYVRGRIGTTNIDLFSVPVLGGEPRFLTANVWSPVSFSADGAKVAFLTRGDKLAVANADGTNKHLINGLSSGEQIVHWSPPSWSPDGKFIAVAVTRGLYAHVGVIPAAGGSERIVGRTDWWKLATPMWVRNGRNLVFVGTLGPTLPQVWEMTYPEGRARQVTNDLARYRKVVPTADANSVSAVRISTASSIWISATSKTSAQTVSTPRQITTGSGQAGSGGLTWLENGRLVYSLETGKDRSIRTTPVDGSNANEVSYREAASAGIDNCGGKFLVFASYDDPRPRLWRMDLDGRNKAALAADAILPACSPDGKSIFYTSTAHAENGDGVWKVSANGGAAAPAAEPGKRARVSPDGQLLAYDVQEAVNQLIIAPMAGGGPRRVLQLGGISTYLFRWAPGGRWIDYVKVDDDDFTIWRVPVDGGSPVKLVGFDSGVIWDFAWSRDGKQLAIAQGPRSEDAVLIRNAAE